MTTTWNNSKSGSELIWNKLKKVYDRLNPSSPFHLFLSPWNYFSEARELWNIEWKIHMIEVLAIYFVYEISSSNISYPQSLKEWLEEQQETNCNNKGWIFDSELFLPSLLSKKNRIVIYFAPQTFEIRVATIGCGNITYRLIDFRNKNSTTTNELKLWALEEIWIILLQIHYFFIMDYTSKITKIMKKANQKYISKTHPLKPLLFYLYNQLIAVMDRGKECTYLMELSLLTKEEGEEKKEIDEFEKKLLFQQKYLDVIKRIRQRCKLKVIYKDKLTSPQIVLKQYHPIYQQLLDEHPKIYEAILNLFDKLRMTTTQNIELEMWSNFIQSHLHISPEAMELGSQYRAIYFLSDLIHLLSYQHYQLILLDKRQMDGLETENCYTLYKRVTPWSKDNLLHFIKEQEKIIQRKNLKKNKNTTNIPPSFVKELTKKQTKQRKSHSLVVIKSNPFLL